MLTIPLHENKQMVGPPGGVESRFPVKKLVISRNPVNNFLSLRIFPILYFFLVIPSSILFAAEIPLFKAVVVEQFPRKLYQGIIAHEALNAKNISWFLIVNQIV